MSELDATTRIHLEEVVALGYLLNAIAHDLNNQLTNLLLGADQAQFTGDKEAIDLVVQQATKLTEITRAVQALGQGNMERGKVVVDLRDIAREAADWQAAAGRPPVTVQGEHTPVRAAPRHLTMALSLLLRWTDSRVPGAPVTITTRVEQVPRSAWSGSKETIPMAVLELVAGDGGDEPTPEFKALVDDFFGGSRSPEEVGVMAAWEVLRKVRGRMTVSGSAAGLKLRLLMPPEAS